MFFTASDFGLHLYWGWTLQWMLFLGVLLILLEHLFPIILRPVASILWIFINSCPCFLLKTVVLKLLGKLSKILWRMATFYSDQVSSFVTFLLTATFQNIVTGLLLRCLTNCKNKKQVFKKEVDLTIFFSIISLQLALSQSVFERNETLKPWSQSNLKLLYLSNNCVRYAKILAFSDPYFTIYEQNCIHISPFPCIHISRIVDGKVRTKRSSYFGIFYWRNI